MPARKLHLRVRIQDRQDVLILANASVKMAELTAKICKRFGLCPHSVNFLYNHRKIDPNKTVRDLKMENEDVIEVTTQQVGGGGEPVHWGVSAGSD